jgi:hypothetical protein
LLIHYIRSYLVAVFFIHNLRALHTLVTSVVTWHTSRDKMHVMCTYLFQCLCVLLIGKCNGYYLAYCVSWLEQL